MLELFGLSLVLSIDSFSGALVLGVKEHTKYQAIILASLSGFFEGSFLFFSSKLGLNLVNQINYYDHWIAFTILVVMSLMFIRDGLLQLLKPNEPQDKSRKLRNLAILLISLGTSLDAFAIGLSMGMLDKTMDTFSIMVGIISFLSTLLGLYMAKLVPKAFMPYFSFISAIILTSIAVSNLH